MTSRRDPAAGRPWAANFGTPFEWFAALGGMVAYALHLVIGFWIVPLACRAGTTLPIHLTTLVLGGAALASTVVAWRWWRRQARAIRAEAAAQGAGGGLLSLPYLLLLVRGRTRTAERLVTSAAAARAAAGDERTVDPTERRRAFMGLFGAVSGGWAVLTILYAESFAWFLGPCT